MRRGWRGKGIVVIGLALGAAAAVAGPRDEAKIVGDKVDITPIRDALDVAHDGSGHYIAAIPLGTRWELYYGDGKLFYRQRVFGGGSDGSQNTASWSFWSPREENHGGLSYNNGSWTVHCGDRSGKRKRETQLNSLSEAAAQKILATASFKTLPFKHTPHSLARDRRGIYYLVDRLIDGKGYRLFVGRRGTMVPYKLIDVVDDSEGQIFVTKKGELRLILDKGEASVTWSKGKQEMKLKEVPVPANRQLIYNDLGVYTTIRLGTPCDDL
jgi:hypothetical protein